MRFFSAATPYPSRSSNSRQLNRRGLWYKVLECPHIDAGNTVAVAIQNPWFARNVERRDIRREVIAGNALKRGAEPDPDRSSCIGPSSGMPPKLPFVPANVESAISELAIVEFVNEPMSSPFTSSMFSKDAAELLPTVMPWLNPTTVLLTSRPEKEDSAIPLIEIPCPPDPTSTLSTIS